MKKPKPHVESAPTRQVQRADLAPATGYAIIVDGLFKTEFAEENAAMKAATELLAKNPRLKIEIYEASSKSRTLVK
jgi:hypothetical protein